ncbi:MAG: DUF924 family protein [Pseudomonadota bacterium]
MTVASPQDVLDYWIGDVGNDPAGLDARKTFWFAKKDNTDRDIAERFLETLRVLAGGRAYDWAELGPRQRLAAIIVLDQFSRNLFRGLPDAFSQDPMALGLCKDALMSGEDVSLNEVERMFLYLPLEHSERQADQALCVQLFENLAATCRPPFKAMVVDSLDYAHRHKVVIDRFGRFPHRNAALGRASTPEEAEYLKQPGSGF